MLWNPGGDWTKWALPWQGTWKVGFMKPPTPQPPTPTPLPPAPQPSSPPQPQGGFDWRSFFELIGRVPPQFWMSVQQPRPYPWSWADVLGTLFQAYNLSRDIAEGDLREEWRQALAQAQTIPEEMRMQYLEQVRNDIAEKAARLGVRSPVTVVPQFEVTTIPLSEADPKVMDSIKELLRRRGVREDQIEAVAAMYGSVRVNAYKTRDGRIIPRASEVAEVTRRVVDVLLTKALDDIDKVDYPIEFPDGTRGVVRISPETALTLSTSEKRWLEDKKWREMLFGYEKEWREREFELRVREFNISRAKDALVTAISLIERGASPERALNAAMNVLGIKQGEVSPELYAVVRGVGEHVRRTVKNEEELRKIQLELARFQLDYERRTLPFRIEAARKELQRIEAEIRATGVRSAADALRLQEARARLNAFENMSRIISNTPPEKWTELTNNGEFVSNLFKVDPNAAMSLLNLSPEKVDSNLVVALTTQSYKGLLSELESMEKKRKPAHERAALVVDSIRTSLLNLDPRKLDQNGRTVLLADLRSRLSILEALIPNVDPKHLPTLLTPILELLATSENLKLPNDVRVTLKRALDRARSRTSQPDHGWWRNLWEYYVRIFNLITTPP